MLRPIQIYMRRRARAVISRRLDHVYAGMRDATEQAKALKQLAERQEAEKLAKLAKEEQALIAQAKHMDSEDLISSLPVRSARAW